MVAGVVVRPSWVRVAVRVLPAFVVLLGVGGAAGCSAGATVDTPVLSSRGATMTTTKPTRQDLTNQVSLAGTVTVNPLYGIAAPATGTIRFRSPPASNGTPTRPTRVATVWAGGKPHQVEVPGGSIFAGRLVDDGSTVRAGMPVVSARLGGYGLVADIDGGQAYLVGDAPPEIRAQIRNGPGPFPCKALGTIAALPAGTLPVAPEPTESTASLPPGVGPGVGAGVPDAGRGTGSEPTGMRLVCTAPGNIKMINGAAAILQVVTARAANALVLPVEAVAGRQGAGKVDVVGPDGTRRTRDVVLGLTDGRVIQIKSGLTGSETIAVPGPDLPPGGPVPGGDSQPGVEGK